MKTKLSSVFLVARRHIVFLSYRPFFSFLFLSLILIISSCKQDDAYKDVSAVYPALLLKASASPALLDQKTAANNGIDFTWTTGSNRGTGASISYTVQVDKKGNNFSKAFSVNMGKAAYELKFTVAQINDSLLKRWQIAAGTSAQIEARVVTSVTSDTFRGDTSNVITLTFTPYQPVTSKLYMVGDATPNGWDIAHATQMNVNASTATKFWYQGPLKVGNFKLPINQNADWAQDMYMKVDDSHIYLHNGGAADDVQWHIDKAGLYRVEVSLLDLTISITALAGPAYTKLYMIGSATPAGWDINNPVALTQGFDNPFIFSYDGVLTAGEFKFPTTTGTWSQDMFMRSDDTHAYLHLGSAAGDDKWTVAKEGYYHLKLNLADNTLSVLPYEVYMVGSATSIDWNIGSALQLTQNASNGYIYTYTGDMKVGEFKFPVNRDGSWGQDMYMRTDDTHAYLHKGGAADDNKWNITAAGNYTISLNIKDLTISIVKN